MTAHDVDRDALRTAAENAQGDASRVAVMTHIGMSTPSRVLALLDENDRLRADLAAAERQVKVWDDHEECDRQIAAAEARADRAEAGLRIMNEQFIEEKTRADRAEGVIREALVHLEAGGFDVDWLTLILFAAYREETGRSPELGYISLRRSDGSWKTNDEVRAEAAQYNAEEAQR